MPGVLGAFAGADLAKDGLGAIPPAVVFPKMFAAAMPPLAVERVRYVGEPIAIVVAETAAQAEDAAAAVEAEIEELPAASTSSRRSRRGRRRSGTARRATSPSTGRTATREAAFARAAHVEKVRLLDTRLAPAAMEPRAAIGAWDAKDERYTLIAGTQGVAVVRRLLAEGVFRIPADKLRVLTYDVGGGFGMKVQAYAEYAALLYAARRVGRPVKWCASRLESFLTDTAGPRRRARGRARARRRREVPRRCAAARSSASAPTPRPSRRSSPPTTRRTASPASTSSRSSRST